MDEKGVRSMEGEKTRMNAEVLERNGRYNTNL